MFTDGFIKVSNQSSLLSGVSSSFKNAAGSMKAISEDVKKATSKLSETSKLLGKGVLGGVGIYGASKLLDAPEAYHRYGYYKAKKELAEKELRNSK